MYVIYVTFCIPANEGHEWLTVSTIIYKPHLFSS
jgi:hypothetical protein